MKIRNIDNRIDKVSIGLNRFHFILLASLAIVLVACSGGGGSDSDPSIDASLSNLVMSAGDFAPSFQSDTTDYSLNVDNAITSTTVTPTTSDSNATATVGGVVVTSGTASADITLVEGDNTITIVVAAEDGTTSRTYTVSVTRLPPPITSFELIDPTPGAGDFFGQQVVLLANGNIVVSDPNDSSLAENNGAAHLYNPLTQTLVASIYGNGPTDKSGSVSITALPNSNFVVVFDLDNVSGNINAGSVILVDGNTGAIIGNPVTGDVADDLLGFGGITALGNSNFIISSPFDDEEGLSNAGSVRLINGSTGLPIGNPIVGDVASDQMGFGGITALSNNNYAISSPADDENSKLEVGSVRLINGTNGSEINAIVGDTAFDVLGSGGITALANNNYVISSPISNDGGTSQSGSVLLVDGETGNLIGSPIVGDDSGDQIGTGGITALENNHVVIASPNDDEGAEINTGSILLMNGATGALVGSPITGEAANDRLGSGGITALANNKFVIASPNDDEGGIVNSGSVRLVDGVSADQIGTPVAGAAMNEFLGSQGVTTLANSNYVIASPFSTESGQLLAGSVVLVNGNTGIQIGNKLVGDNASDQLGSNGVVALSNNNYVIVSDNDIVGGIGGAGSIKLVNGETGVQIGSTIAGDTANDALGNNGVTALQNGNYLVASSDDDEEGIVNAGTIRLGDGETGIELGITFVGSISLDLSVSNIIESSTGDFYILSLSLADNNGLVDSGLVRLIAE